MSYAKNATNARKPKNGLLRVQLPPPPPFYTQPVGNQRVCRCIQHFRTPLLHKLLHTAGGFRRAYASRGKPGRSVADEHNRNGGLHMQDFTTGSAGNGQASRGFEPWGERQSLWRRIKKALGPVGVALVVIVKFVAKLKFVILPVIKFLPLLLKTGGTMVLSIGAYALAWGWKFALGFVLLLLVHECGHLLAARRVGLQVGAPVFIPFMGAFIAMKEAPRDAWIEAQVGLGGPLMGGLGALLCWGLYVATGQPLFSALAYSGFLLNLFNLMPVGFLDGGRIVSAISLWLWVIGLAVAGTMLAMRPNLLLAIILIASLPHMWTRFRKRKSEYYELSPMRRRIMAVVYFGLIILLAAGMAISHVNLSR